MMISDDDDDGTNDKKRTRRGQEEDTAYHAGYLSRMTKGALCPLFQKRE